MNGLAKFSYILLGIGIGIIGTSLVYEHDLTKAIGEDEVYIPDDEPLDDEEEEEYEPDDFDEFNDISKNYQSDDSKPESSDGPMHNPNMKSRYSKMYEEPKEKLKPLSQIEREYLDYIQESHPEEEPGDDEELEYFDDKDLNVELIEPNFAVYIGDIPNDYAELYWYNEDSTLTDDRDGIVPHPYDVIGKESIKRLIDRGPGAEDGVVYVRNLKTSINYEVVFCANSYSKTVLGIFESRRKGARGNDGK